MRPRRSDPRNRPRQIRRRVAFTLVELLVVILIIALLIGLLVPAVMRAVGTANDAAVAAELNAMAQSMAAFKNQYGDYFPSRIVLSENGDFTTTTLGTFSGLQQRSVQAIRRFWPRVILNTTTAGSNAPGVATTGTSQNYYDFNGNGQFDSTPYVLQGHECLVFFLGGIPNYNATTGGWSMTGFGKSPTNPFTVNVPGAQNSSTNRTVPLYEFKPGQLATSQTSIDQGVANFPCYLDRLGAASVPNLQPAIIYFSSYGGVGYDPDDVNFKYEPDSTGNYTPVLGALMTSNGITGSFPVTGGSGTLFDSSPSPNPYTSDDPIPTKSSTPFYDTTNSKPRSYYNPQSFQLISPGRDRMYGIGGQYDPKNPIGLPWTGNIQQATAGITGQTLGNDARAVEADNITNFATGRLGQ